MKSERILLLQEDVGTGVFRTPTVLQSLKKPSLIPCENKCWILLLPLRVALPLQPVNVRHVEVVQSPGQQMFNAITYNFAKRDGNSQTCHEGRHLLALRCLPEAKLDTPLLVSSLIFDKGLTLELT